MPPGRRNTGLLPQDLAITIAGAHLREPDERVWSGGFVELLRAFDFSTQAARAALARLVNRELLAREMEGRRAFYRLTPRAITLLEEGDRRIYGFGRVPPGGDTWTVLWHVIPESRRAERAQLASRLRFLGFGSVQDGTWVAAHDRESEVVESLASLGISDFATVIVGKVSDRLAPTPLVREAWHLDGVDERYQQFIADYEPFSDPAARRALSARDAFVTRTLVLHRFRAFPFLDPELPSFAGGSSALRRRAVSVFDAAFDGLAEPAAAYFTAVGQPTFAAATS